MSVQNGGQFTLQAELGFANGSHGTKVADGTPAIWMDSGPKEDLEARKDSLGGKKGAKSLWEFNGWDTKLFLRDGNPTRENSPRKTSPSPANRGQQAWNGVSNGNGNGHVTGVKPTDKHAIAQEELSVQWELTERLKLDLHSCEKGRQEAGDRAKQAEDRALELSERVERAERDLKNVRVLSGARVQELETQLKAVEEREERQREEWERQRAMMQATVEELQRREGLRRVEAEAGVQEKMREATQRLDHTQHALARERQLRRQDAVKRQSEHLHLRSRTLELVAQLAMVRSALADAVRLSKQEDPPLSARGSEACRPGPGSTSARFLTPRGDMHASPRDLDHHGPLSPGRSDNHWSARPSDHLSDSSHRQFETSKISSWSLSHSDSGWAGSHMESRSWQHQQSIPAGGRAARRLPMSNPYDVGFQYPTMSYRESDTGSDPVWAPESWRSSGYEGWDLAQVPEHEMQVAPYNSPARHRASGFGPLSAIEISLGSDVVVSSEAADRPPSPQFEAIPPPPPFLPQLDAYEPEVSYEPITVPPRRDTPRPLVSSYSIAMASQPVLSTSRPPAMHYPWQLPSPPQHYVLSSPTVSAGVGPVLYAHSGPGPMGHGVYMTT